jgi:tRNA(Ile)-lysidine synthase
MELVLERIAEIISRYSMFAPGQNVGVAVSGGADSVCLLHVLRELAPRWELRLSILHLDHQMRGEESLRDAEFVRELAAGLGLPLRTRTVDVPRLTRETGDNLEQAARQARRGFFLELLGSGAVQRVALGHTRNDQAETVLFRILRGAWTAGLSGMRPVTPEGFVRPLLETGRPEVIGWLREREIPWREDTSNLDRRFARNRIRHDLLPALERDWNPEFTQTLAQMAKVAQDEEKYWRGEVEALVASELQLGASGAVLFRAAWLDALPIAFARRVVRRAIELARGDLRRIGFEHVEQVLRLAGLPRGSGRIQIPGVDIFRSFDWMRLAPPGLDTLENRNYRIEVSVPGRYPVPGTGAEIELELLEAVSGRPGDTDSGYNIRGSELDWGRISGRLELRNWRPGDQYTPVGHASQARIKLLFKEARIPLWQRRKWPVIAFGEAILWAAQFGPAAEYAATPRTQTILKVREIGDFTEITESYQPGGTSHRI